MQPLSDMEIHEYNQALLTRIRELCVRRNTSITKIEKALGYGNGTVSGWKNAKRKAPHDRVVAVANFLNVPVMALTGEEGQKETPALSNENELSAVQKEAINFIRSLSDEQLSRFIRMGQAAFEKEDA